MQLAVSSWGIYQINTGFSVIDISTDLKQKAKTFITCLSSEHDFVCF